MGAPVWETVALMTTWLGELESTGASEVGAKRAFCCLTFLNMRSVLGFVHELGRGLNYQAWTWPVVVIARRKCLEPSRIATGLPKDSGGISLESFFSYTTPIPT